LSFLKYIASSRDVHIVCEEDVHILVPNELGAVLDYAGAEKPVVIYRRSSDIEQRQFIVAHELGHIFAGHTNFPRSEFTMAGANRELEATMLGAVIWGCRCMRNTRRRIKYRPHDRGASGPIRSVTADLFQIQKDAQSGAPFSMCSVLEGRADRR